MSERTEIVISAKDETAAAFQAISGNIKGFDSALTGLLGPIGGVYGAMTALAGTLGLMKFGSAIMESIEFAGSLKNMSEKSGASVESLSMIAPAASIAGVGMDEVAGAVTKLSKGMATADDTSKGTGKALAALGLSARDSNGQLKDAGALYIEIANKLGQYKDGVGKTAAAIDLYGKTGAAQIPVMNDLAEAQKYGIVVTKEQAAAADEYDKNLKRLGLAQSAMAKIIGIEVAPVLADFTKVLLDSATGAGGLTDNIKELAADGSIRNWAQQAAIGIGYVIDAFDGVIRVVDIVGKAIAAGVAQIVEMFTGIGEAMKLALSGKFGEAAEAVKASFGRMKSIGNEFVVDFDTIMSKSTFSDRLKAQFDASNAAAKGAKTATAEVGLEYGRTSEKADKYAEAMKKLVAGIEEGNDKLRVELETIYDNKAARATANVELEREKALRGVTSAATRQQINDLFDERAALVKAIEAKKEQKAAMEEYVKALIKQGEESIKNYDLQLKLVSGMKDETAALEKQITTFGMSKTALALYNLEEKTRLLLEKELDPVIRTSIENEHDRQQALILTIDSQEQAAEATKRWEDTLKQADAVGYDFFQAMGDGMDGIKNWAKSAGEALKKYLLAVLYEMTAKPFVVSIMTAITGGASGFAQAATGGGGLPSINSLFGGNGSNPLGSLSNLFGGNTLGVPGGALGTFATSSIGESLGLSTALGAGEGSVLTGLGTAFTAAVPWAAVAALAIPAIMKFLKKDPSQVEGTFSVSAGTTGFEDNAYTETAFGNIGFSDQGTRYFSGEAAQSFNSIVKIALDAFAAAMTSEQIASVAGKLQGTIFYMAKGNYTTEDFIKEYGGDVLKKTLGVVADELDVRLGDIVRNFQGTGDELAAFAVTLANVYTMVEKLPEDVGNTLLEVLAAGVLTVEEIGRFSTAYVGLQNVMAVDPVALVLDQMSASNATAYDKVMTLRGGLDELLQSYDGSVAGTEALYGATMEYVQAQIAAIAQIEGIKASLVDMFSESHTLIADFFLTNDQKAAKLMQDAEEYQRLLNETLDPTLIEKYSKIINSDLTSAFQLLSPEQQRAQQADFLQRIDTADALAQSRLTASTESITQKGNEQLSIMAAIRDALNSAASSMIEAARAMKSAADTQSSAATTSLQAAHTPVKVDVDSYVYVEYIDPSNGA